MHAHACTRRQAEGGGQPEAAPQLLAGVAGEGGGEIDPEVAAQREGLLHSDNSERSMRFITWLGVLSLEGEEEPQEDSCLADAQRKGAAEADREPHQRRDFVRVALADACTHHHAVFKLAGAYAGMLTAMHACMHACRQRASWAGCARTPQATRAILRHFPSQVIKARGRTHEGVRVLPAQAQCMHGARPARPVHCKPLRP